MFRRSLWAAGTLLTGYRMVLLNVHPFLKTVARAGILALLATASLRTSEASGVRFDWPKNAELQKFFGNARGSYIEQNASLAFQLEQATGVDLSATGRLIRDMLPLGRDEYLDPGFVQHDAVNGGALIVKSSGKIVAAAVDWSRCYSPWDCDDNSRFLTIFIRHETNLSRVKAIFERWAELYEKNLRAEPFFTDVSGTLDWGNPVHGPHEVAEVVTVK